MKKLFKNAMAIMIVLFAFYLIADAAYRVIYIYRPSTWTDGALKSIKIDANGKLQLTDQSDNVMKVISEATDGTLDIASDLDITGDFSVSGATALSGTVALGDSTDDVITYNGKITSNQTYTAGTTPFYFRTTLSATSGSHNNARFRGQSGASSASTSDIRGLYAQGVTNEALYGGTVTAIYANTIAKTTSTTTTLRGILIDTETEGTPDTVANMYGMYIRNKSTVTIGGDNYSMVIDNEKMGTGIVQDAGIQLKTTTWGSGVTAWTYGIDMNQTGAFGTADIRLSNGEVISNTTDGVIDITAANLRSATYNYADTTAVGGGADSVAIDFTPDITVASGTMITFIAEAANTGAVQINVDGAGPLALSEYNGAASALDANDIRSGQIVTICYNGTQWYMMSPSGN